MKIICSADRLMGHNIYVLQPLVMRDFRLPLPRRIVLDLSTLEDGTVRLSRKVSKDYKGVLSQKSSELKCLFVCFVFFFLFRFFIFVSFVSCLLMVQSFGCQTDKLAYYYE